MFARICNRVDGKDMSTELIKEYKHRSSEIKAKLEWYRHRGLHTTDEEIFEVMCHCICSPRTDYTGVRNAIQELKQNSLLLSGSTVEIARYLKKHKVRFPNRKAGYIIKARAEFLGDNAEIRLRHIMALLRGIEPLEARKRLRELLRGFGLGMKETSEFLRNLGLGSNYAILDSRILEHLKKYGVIKEIPKPLTRKAYIETENKMRKWSKDIDIPLDELDILLWH